MFPGAITQGFFTIWAENNPGNLYDSFNICDECQDSDEDISETDIYAIKISKYPIEFRQTMKIYFHSDMMYSVKDAENNIKDRLI